MDIYETLYLITVTLQLGGQEFMDTLAVVFAIIITGYFAGPRMERPMIWGLTVISALFVGPMTMAVYGTIQRAVAMVDSLPSEQVEQLPYLANFVVMSGSPITAGILPASLALAYVGAIYFGKINSDRLKNHIYPSLKCDISYEMFLKVYIVNSTILNIKYDVINFLSAKII